METQSSQNQVQGKSGNFCLTFSGEYGIYKMCEQPQTQTLRSSTMATMNQEVIDLIRGYVRHFSRSMPALMRFNEVDDLVNEVVVKFIRHNHLEKFDSNRTSLKYHVMYGVKTTLIDILRKEKNKIRELSTNAPISSEDGQDEFQDFVEAPAEDPSDRIYLSELLSELKTHFKEWGPRFVSPLLGEIRTSAFTVYLHYLVGYQFKEIGTIFGFSGSRASQLVDEVVNWMESAGIRQPVLSL